MPLFFHFFTMAEICMLGRKYRKCSFVGSTFQPEHKIIVPKCLLASVTWSFVVSFLSECTWNGAQDSCAWPWALSWEQATALTTLSPSSVYKAAVVWRCCRSVFPDGRKRWDGKKDHFRDSQILHVLSVSCCDVLEGSLETMRGVNQFRNVCLSLQKTWKTSEKGAALIVLTMATLIFRYFWRDHHWPLLF